MAQTCIVAGATGLIGTNLLRQLSTDREFYEVRVLSRHEPDVEAGKIHTTTANFSMIEEIADDVFSGVTTVFCCLGTTMAKAGSKDEFVKVDKSYVLELARMAEKHKIRNFLVVSAVSAQKDSRFFYNRVKGEMEEQLLKLDIPYIGIFRPSLLHGSRNEVRIGEQFARLGMRLINPFLVGKSSKYKSIYARDVAAAMIAASKSNKTGTEAYQHGEIKNLIRQDSKSA